jgi:hypothetical protein
MATKRSAHASLDESPTKKQKAPSAPGDKDIRPKITSTLYPRTSIPDKLNIDEGRKTIIADLKTYLEDHNITIAKQEEVYKTAAKDKKEGIKRSITVLQKKKAQVAASIGIIRLELFVYSSKLVFTPKRSKRAASFASPSWVRCLALKPASKRGRLGRKICCFVYSAWMRGIWPLTLRNTPLWMTQVFHPLSETSSHYLPTTTRHPDLFFSSNRSQQSLTKQPLTEQSLTQQHLFYYLVRWAGDWSPRRKRTWEPQYNIPREWQLDYIDRPSYPHF